MTQMGCPSRVFLRALTGSIECRMSTQPPAAAPSADSSCSAAVSADSATFPLKIGGLFLILVTSLLGALLPLFSRSNKMPTLYLLARAFAGKSAAAKPWLYHKMTE